MAMRGDDPEMKRLTITLHDEAGKELGRKEERGFPGEWKRIGPGKIEKKVFFPWDRTASYSLIRNSRGEEIYRSTVMLPPGLPPEHQDMIQVWMTFELD